MSKKIAIIGTTTSMMDAPYKDNSWEIWGLNGAYSGIPKWDRWFDMHDMSVLKQVHKPTYFDFLKSAKDKLMLNKKYKDFPDAGVFPYQELVDKYGKYFTNTVSWLIAYAIEQEPEEIAIYGVNMAQDTEYAKQRPSCEYFLGIAQGKGIKVTIPESSEMLKATHLYGFEKVPSIIAKMPDKRREINCNQNEIEKELEEAKSKVNQINGYIQAINDFYEKNIKDIKDKEVIKKIDNFKKEHIEDAKNQAYAIKVNINELCDKKAYWKGANDLLNYFKINWG
jgi:hypothetical protein